MHPKKEKILESILPTFVEQGVSVSTADLAKAAGISNGTLFNYFPSKQTLIDELYVWVQQLMIDNLDRAHVEGKPARAFFFDVWRLFVTWGIDNPHKLEASALLRTTQAVSDDVLDQVSSHFDKWREYFDSCIANKQIVPMDFEHFCLLTNSQLQVAVKYAQSQQLESMELGAHIIKSFEIYWNGVTVFE